MCTFGLDFGHVAERLFDIGERSGGDEKGTSSYCLFWATPMLAFYTTFALLLADYVFLVIYVRIVFCSFRKYILGRYVGLSSRWFSPQQSNLWVGWRLSRLPCSASERTRINIIFINLHLFGLYTRWISCNELIIVGKLWLWSDVSIWVITGESCRSSGYPWRLSESIQPTNACPWVRQSRIVRPLDPGMVPAVLPEWYD